MKHDTHWRILWLAFVVILLDQVSKFVVLKYLGFAEEDMQALDLD